MNSTDRHTFERVLAIKRRCLEARLRQLQRSQRDKTNQITAVETELARATARMNAALEQASCATSCVVTRQDLTNAQAQWQHARTDCGDLMNSVNALIEAKRKDDECVHRVRIELARLPVKSEFVRTCFRNAMAPSEEA